MFFLENNLKAELLRCIWSSVFLESLFVVRQPSNAIKPACLVYMGRSYTTPTTPGIIINQYKFNIRIPINQAVFHGKYPAGIFVVAQLYIPQAPQMDLSRYVNGWIPKSMCEQKAGVRCHGVGGAWETPGSWARETGWIRDWSSNIAGSLKLSLLFQYHDKYMGTKGLVFREGISEEHGCQVAQSSFCEFCKGARALQPRRGCHLNFPLMTTSYRVELFSHVWISTSYCWWATRNPAITSWGW